MTTARNGPAVSAALAALALVAALPFTALIHGTAWLGAAAGAVALVTAASWILSPRRPVAVAVAAAVATLATLAAVALVATGVPAGPALLVELVRLPGAGRALLSAPVPAPATPALLVLPVAGAAVAAFVAAELAARSRWPVLGTTAPAGLLVLALVSAGRAGSPAPAVVAAFVTGVLAVAALSGAPRPRPAGAGLAALAGLACLAAAGTVPPATPARFDPRDRQEPVPAATVAVDALGRAGAALAAPADPVVFRITVAGGSADRLRLRVATLDEYDGTQWRTGRPFVPAGEHLPHRYPATGSVVQRITLTGDYPGPYLPALAGPVALGEPGRDAVRYDREVGDLLAPDHRDGFRYEVVSDGGGVPQSPGSERLREQTALPGPVPESLRTAALGLPDGPPHHRATALADRLAAGPWGYDPQGPPGQSYPRLDQFLRVGTTSGWMPVATVEQPAAAYAVLARLAGLPSRVVVGYDVPLAGAPATADGRTVAVTAHQVRAWVEVHLDGQGWTPFDVSPTGPRPVAADALSVATSSTSTTMVEAGRAPAGAAAPPPAGNQPGDGPGAPAGDPCAGCDAGSDRDRWGPALPALVPLAAGGVVAAKALRRRYRRRRRSPAARLAGAWAESLASLRSRGVAVTPAMTGTDLVRAAGPAVGEVAAAVLGRWARVLDTAVYAAAEPGDELADEAWRIHAELVAALRAGIRAPRRLLAAVDPRW